MSDTQPVPVVMIGLALGDTAGDRDFLVGAEVVPDGREGNRVFARTLAHDESHPGGTVLYNPAAGEVLAFRPGALRYTIHHVDRLTPECPDGYRPLAGTLWTWLGLYDDGSDVVRRYLLALGRRLDSAHRLFELAESARQVGTGVEVPQRASAFQALGLVEMMFVALSRAVDMIVGAQQELGLTPNGLQLPDEVRAALTDIRNAFEHVEDRALGRVRRQDDPIAVTAFDQPDFIASGAISYGSHVVRMQEDVLPVLISARAAVYGLAVQAVAEARSNPELVTASGTRATLPPLLPAD